MKIHFMQTLSGQILSEKENMLHDLKNRYPDFFQAVEMMGYKYRIHFTSWSKSLSLMVYFEGSNTSPGLSFNIPVKGNQYFEYTIDKMKAFRQLENFRRCGNPYCDNDNDFI